MELSKKQWVSISTMDTEGNLSVLGTYELIQDAITELMGLNKADGRIARDVYNALWVYVKTRVKFYKKIAWKEDYTVNAFFSCITPAKIAIDVEVKNTADEVAVYSRTELCALDITTQRIRRMFTVGINADLLTKRQVPEIEFSKFDTVDLPVVDTVKVKSTNIDYSHHTNNTEYVRFIMNTYSVAEIEKMQIKEIELVYAGQSFENDILTLKKLEQQNKHLAVLEKDGSPVIKCEITLGK